MRLAVLVSVVSVGSLLGSCRQPPAGPSPFDGGAKTSSAPAIRPLGNDGDGRFFARGESGDEYELALRKLAVQVTTRPGTVRSHLTMEIAAPKLMRAEAIVRLPVPPGAAVTRAVLWVNGRPMNGAFVERERARQIYRSIVERKRDPALVTWDGPGWVSVAIFPLENGETRRFELEWVEPAAIDRGFLVYRVPKLSDRGRLIGRAALEVNGNELPHGGRDVVPLSPTAQREGSVVAGRAPGDPFHRLLVHGVPVQDPPSVVIVAETSAAMTATDRVRQRRAVAAVLDRLPATAKVSLLAADWDTNALAEDATRDDARKALGKLDAIVSAGALHLERALHDAGVRAHKTGAGALLFVGRGVDGFPGDGVRQPLAELRAASIRLSVVATGELSAPIADAAALTGGQTLATTDLDTALPALMIALYPRPARPALVARGIDEWRPLETISGQTVWVGRALEPPAGTGGETPLADADPADLIPLWDRARLAWTERAGRAPAPSHARASALSPLRALLVLETEQDYTRFGLAVPDPVAGRGQAAEDTPPEKPAERTIGLGASGSDSALGSGASSVFGLLSNRSNEAPEISNGIGNAYGVGGLGMLGTGGGGSGTGVGTIGLGNLGTIGKGARNLGSFGYGRGAGGLGGRRAKAPDVLPGIANVRGSLDKEIVRRIVRRHVNEVKYCYEMSLARRPGLSGRVNVQFTIAASGQVLASVVQTSTLGDASAESCIVNAVKRWEFPKPNGGGLVIVSYPFTLVPAATDAAGDRDGVTIFAAQRTDPALEVRDALKLLGGRGELGPRVERIASLLGFDHTTDAESLAWMIDRATSDNELLTLVARLLVSAGRPRHAVRVLSEGAAANPTFAAAELRHIGAGTDADEVVALARRAR